VELMEILLRMDHMNIPQTFGVRKSGPIRQFQRFVWLFAVSVSLALGSPIISTGYITTNGQTGAWIYQDDTYLPCAASSCTTDLALLSGGSGRLTDGVAPAFSWNSSGQGNGTTLPWVGWYAIDPTITFNFAEGPAILQVGLYLDNTPGRGVSLPSQVIIGGQSFAVTPDTQFGPRWVYFDVSPISATSLDITLDKTAGNWLMLGEVSFDSSADAPEPASVLLIFAPVAGILWFRRRQPNC